MTAATDKKIKGLHQHLRTLTGAAGNFIRQLDDLMKGPGGFARGQAISKLVNGLEMANDSARHFGLGDRLDDKSRFATDLEVPQDPIPMLLVCPMCHNAHIDREEWAKRRHHTHRCEVCKAEWRPSNFATVGVKELPPLPE